MLVTTHLHLITDGDWVGDVDWVAVCWVVAVPTHVDVRTHVSPRQRQPVVAVTCLEAPVASDAMVTSFITSANMIAVWAVTTLA